MNKNKLSTREKNGIYAVFFLVVFLIGLVVRGINYYIFSYSFEGKITEYFLTGIGAGLFIIFLVCYYIEPEKKDK